MKNLPKKHKTQTKPLKNKKEISISGNLQISKYKMIKKIIKSS